VVVVEPLNLELLNGLNRLNIAKRLNVLNRRRGTGVALRGKDSSEPIRFGSEFGEVNSQKGYRSRLRTTVYILRSIRALE
jgi:hypothetical protein